MRRPKAVTIVTAVALLFAGLASWGVYSYLQEEARKSKASAGGAVVVAAADIPVGTQLNSAHLKLVNWPRESIPPGSFADSKPLFGRVAVRHLSPGDSVTEQKLMPREGTAGAGVMTYIVPQGHRAVTVGVNEVAGVAGFLAPQNRVDIVLTTQIPSSPSQNISKIVLQDVPILATGQITEQKEGKPAIVPTVTLDLTPGDAEKLILASSKGSLQLLLRNIVDTAPAEANGATISKLLYGVEHVPIVTAAVSKPRHHVRLARIAKTSPPPSPSPPISINVEIIKGKERTTKQFTE